MTTSKDTLTKDEKRRLGELLIFLRFSDDAEARENYEYWSRVRNGTGDKMKVTIEQIERSFKKVGWVPENYVGESKELRTE